MLSKKWALKPVQFAPPHTSSGKGKKNKYGSTYIFLLICCEKYVRIMK